MTFYGPHMTDSKVAAYPCFSLLRTYKGERDKGDIYIYVESGYKYFQKLIPEAVLEYYGAAEPPVRCGESHLSGLTEPPHFVY